MFLSPQLVFSGFSRLLASLGTLHLAPRLFKELTLTHTLLFQRRYFFCTWEGAHLGGTPA